jgi:hypothetical protein
MVPADTRNICLAFLRVDPHPADSKTESKTMSFVCVEKSLEKFRVSLEKGSIYEAQQLIKIVYHRLRSRKLMEESRQLLEIAACLQLDHEQVRKFAIRNVEIPETQPEISYITTKH